MLPAIERISLARLYEYRKAHAAARHKYRVYDQARCSVNRIIEILERAGDCARLSRELFILNNEIRVAQKGVIDRSGTLANEDLAVDKDNVSQRMLAKSLGRPLLQQSHPDQGGDPERFTYVLDAVRRGDVLLLRMLLAELGPCNLTWQCGDGVEHMRLIASVYESRLSKIRSNPLSDVARLYLRGKREQAEQRLATFIRARISERRIELHNLLRSTR